MHANQIGLFTLPKPGMRNLEGIDCAKELGLTAFEPFGTADFDDDTYARRMRAHADEMGVTLPCLSVVADLYHDESGRERERLIRMARAAAEMGCGLLHHTLLPGLSPRAAYPAPTEAIPVVAARAREVYDAAERLGVRCVYEDQGYVFDGIQPFLAFLNALDRPAGVVLDVGNICFAGEDAEAFAEAVKDRIAHVHLKDFALLPAPAPKAFALPSGAFAQPVVLGHGSVNVRGALATLKRISYTGRLMLEHSGPMEEQIACIQTLQTWLA